jgi:uncharacterized protein YfkK (UPF0435 family)
MPMFDIIFRGFFDTFYNPLDHEYQRKIEGKEHQLLEAVNKELMKEDYLKEINMQQLFDVLEVIRKHEVFSE